MMKKILTLTVALCLVCAAFSGCAVTENPVPAGSAQTPGSSAEGAALPSDDTALPSDDAALPSDDAALPSEGGELDGAAGGNILFARTNGVDVDLTTLSSTMVYAEVFNMMNNPDAYVGKTVKARGLYQASFFEETAQYYHFVVVEDALACCQQGLEFAWRGAHSYPDDYPPNQALVETTGVFGSYEELGQTYYRLTVSDVTIL